MVQETLIVPEKEYELLRKHCSDSGLSNFNKNKLLAELAGARIIPAGALPADAVRVNSQVELRETGSGQLFSFQIVWPQDADIRNKKMSALAPLSIALLGYRSGALVDWEMPGGVKTFEILKVLQV